jgi:hypothetical protein
MSGRMDEWWAKKWKNLEFVEEWIRTRGLRVMR